MIKSYYSKKTFVQSMKIHAFQLKMPSMCKSDEMSIVYCFKVVSTNICSYAVKRKV